jgi:hypothetical protein
LGVYINNAPDYLKLIRPNLNYKTELTYYAEAKEMLTTSRTLRGKAFYKITFNDDTSVVKSVNLVFEFKENSSTAWNAFSIRPIDASRSDIKRLQNEYIVYTSNEAKFRAEKENAQKSVSDT